MLNRLAVVKVLLRVPNWLGDAVLALPAVAALAERDDVRLTVLAPPPLHPLFDAIPRASLSPIDPRADGLRFTRAVGHALRGDDEVGVLLPISLSSALILRFAGVPRRIGRAAEGRSRLLTEVLPPRPVPRRPILPGDVEAAGDRFHRWRDYAELAEHVLGSRVPERYPLTTSPAAEEQANRLLGELTKTDPLIAFHPGANTALRRWPADRFAALGRELHTTVGARIAILGGGQEVGLAATIAKAIPGAYSLAGRTTLGTLIACLRRVSLVVTNDTGPMHLASVVGVPVLDLCGAADERVTGPRGAQSRVVREHLFCSPCVLTVCPFNVECMDGLTVARVLAEALDLLHAPAASSPASA